MGVRENYIKRKEEDKKDIYGGVRTRYIINNIDNISNNILGRVTAWQNKTNSLFKEYEKRFSGRTGTYADAYVSDTATYLDSVKKTSKELEAERDAINKYISKYSDFLDSDALNSITSLFDTSSYFSDIVKQAEIDAAFWKQFKNKSAYDEWAKSEKVVQEVKKLDDFDKYSKIGANIKNPTYDEADSSDNLLKWKNPFVKGKEIGNIVTFSRDNIDAIDWRIAMSNSNGDIGYVLGDYRYRFLTEDEVSVYNYYLGKGDKKKADEFLASLDDKLNQIHGGQIAETVSGNALLETVFAAGAGLEQFISGIKNLDNFFTGSEADAPSATQYASSLIREDLDGFMGGVYDLTQTTTNMLPSILFGSLTGGIGGAAMMGISAGGNAYAEMRTLGYDEWQSRGYALLVGISETTLQNLLGGIGKLGGKVSGNAVGKLVSKFDHAIARVAIKLGGNMASEGLEEAVQSVLEPAFKALVTGEDFEGVDWDEVFYSGLLGALSAGLLEGVPTIAGTLSKSYNAKKIYGSSAKELVTESLEIDPTNKFASKMQNRLEKGKNISGYDLNRLVEENESTMRKNDVNTIQRAVENRLTELGESGDVKAIAKVLTKKASGEKLTAAENRIIKNSKFGQRVANELDTDNIKSGEYSSAWAEKIGTDRINVEEYSRLISEAQSPHISEADAQSQNLTVEAQKDVAKQIPVSKSNEALSQEIEGTEVVKATEAKSVPNTERVSPVTSTDADTEITLDSVIAENHDEYKLSGAAMRTAYNEGQDADSFAHEYNTVFNHAYSGTMSLDRVKKLGTFSTLTNEQIESAYKDGKDASAAKAKSRDDEIKTLANGKTGRKEGVVKGDGVSINDLRSTFNDTQNVAYKVLSRIAEVTGIDIVLYKSELTKGKFTEAQGRYERKSNPDTIFIDINAGLSGAGDVGNLASYTMLRTFSHEFCHFIENFNPIWYNELRSAVFERLSEKGTDVSELIAVEMEKTNKTYDEASREVVAQALTDVLPDSKFVENLANKHKRVFNALLERLKEFLADIKAYFATLGTNNSREARAMKEQIGDSIHYVESIVEIFDKAAEGAVENYQQTVAVDEVVAEDGKATEEADAIKDATTTEYEHFTITDNAEYGSLEIKFDGKPSEAVRNVLKEHKFRWHNVKGVWYGKGERADIASALDKAYAEKSTENQPSAEKIDSVDAIKADNNAEKGAGKKKARSEEEKQAARKKQIGVEAARLLALSPERQKYLADKFNQYRGILKQLENGDKLINDNGDVVGVVVNISDGCIFIVGEEGFVEMTLPKSFTDDGIISTLEVGDGHFEKADGTIITDKASEKSALDKAYFDSAKVKAESEFDAEGNPIFETERHKAEPTDLELLKQIRKASDEKYGLTKDQSFALTMYVKGLAYLANQKVLDGTASNRDIAYIQNMIEAIQKFPVYNGRTYRNVMFQNEQDYNSFLEKNLQDEVVKLKAITSSSKRPNGYPLFGKYVVHIVIDGVSGRDIADTYGVPKQQEVLFLPGTQYKVNSVSVANDGHPIIYAKEIANNEVQIGNGDNGGRQSESTRNSGNDRIVSQGEGNDVGRVLLHDGGRTETAEKVRDSEIRNADVKQTEVKTEPTFTEIFENATQAELDSKRARHKEVMDILNPKEEQKLDSIDESSDTQYQRRDYLEENDGNEENENGDVRVRGRGYGENDRGMGVEVGSENREHEGISSVQGDRQSESRGRLSVSDSEGRRIKPEISEKIKDSKIVDPDGNPLALYHYTPGMDFAKISKSSDIGFHSGTIEQAIGRAKRNNGRIFRSYYNIKSPLNLRTDIGSWKPKMLNLYLWAEGYISDIENAEIEALLVGDNNQDYNSSASVRLREILGSYGYDGISYPNGVEGDGNAYIAFTPDQIITTEILKYENGEVLPGEDVQYQERNQTLTDRDILQMAAEELRKGELTDGEQSALDIFQKRLAVLEEKVIDREEQGRIYKEQMFTKGGDRTEAAKTLERMKILDKQIEDAQNAVLDVENKAVFRDILHKARKIVERNERAHGQELLRRYRERRENAASVRKYRERIKADVAELSKWIVHPDNKNAMKHVPDVLKNTVIDFITNIDFTSKKHLKGGDLTKADREFLKNAEALRKAIKNSISVDGMYSGYNDLPEGFMDKLESLIEATEELTENNGEVFVINKMSAAELNALSSIVKNLKAYITQINKFHANAMYEHVYEAGDNSIEFMSQLKTNNKANGVSNFLFWQQMRPAYAFERFGKGGKAIYDGLRRGQAKLAFNTKDIKAFAESVYTASEVKEWEKETKTITLSFGTAKMTVAQMMGFYELSKQSDSLRHILNGGIRVATYKDGKEKIADVGHRFTNEDVEAVINALTPRQKEVADNLQRYMATKGAQWGNYVSVARFGEELFTNPQYYPINSDGRHLDANVEEAPSAASLYALLNMNFTKSRNEQANNRIVLYSIFDVFSNHMASMAQYNAMALPVLDAVKWLNYKQVEIAEDGSKTTLSRVREEMDRAYGVSEETKPGSGAKGYAQSFVINIIKGYNGTAAQGTTYDSHGLKALHAYNRAQIAFNFRVVIQQPLAITRAGMLIDYKSIIKGLKLSPSAISANVKEMRAHSGIAAWKELGFYDINISRGVTSIIKQDETVFDKITDIGMWGAEKADTLTWAAIWSACKMEVERKQRLTPTDEGYFEAVTELFEDVIYKTQVVDSVLTKNEFVRDKGFFAKAMASFMSEPTTTVSMLLDSYDKYQTDLQRGMSKQQAWAKNKAKIARTVAVYSTGAIMLAAVQAVADGLRDDDDYKTFLEKWLEAFSGNVLDELMPVNKLPIASDFYEATKELISIWTGLDIYGNPPQSVFMQWYDVLIKGNEIFHDKIFGEGTNYTWYAGIYKLLQAASGITGLPLATATREAVTIWNNTVGTMAPSLKVKDYDAGPLADIKYAFKDGYLTAEEATDLLLETGLAEDENEAYYLIEEWSDKDGSYSKYDDLENALLNGGVGFEDAAQDLIAHGKTEKEVKSQVKRILQDLFKENEITESKALSLLTEYVGFDGDEAREKVDFWIFRRDNPDGYDDLTEASYTKYKEVCEPYGVSIDAFYDAFMYRKEINGDDGLTSKQKERKIRDYIYQMNINTNHKRRLIACWFS